MELKNTAPLRMHVAFACLGLAFLLIFAWVVFHEQTAEWRATQADFSRLEGAVKNPHQLAESARVTGLRQIWLADLGRVDRCGTCHLGIDDPAFATAPQPHRTHSGAWLTTHPPDRFGCTACHDGEGQATDYRSAAHQPQPFVTRPMRPLETIEANCGTCHRSIDPLDAPRLAEGRRLIIESGCFSCHEIPGFEGLTFRGPALDSLGYKVLPEWLAVWLRDPRSYLEQSKMGNFRLSADEIAGLQGFLLSQRAQVPLDSTGVDWTRADTRNGRALFGEMRCVSCHAVNGRGGTMGPELTRIGDKVRRSWLFSYLKDPHRVQPDTPMLRYRLNDAQLRDVTAFLLEEYSSAGTVAEPPPAAYQDARSIAAGRTVFERRGCISCHRLPGIEDSGRIGPSLAGVADRDPDQLPYGSEIVRHTAENYIFLKLLIPDALGQPSSMPTFGFTPADAARMTLALASLRKADLPASYVLKPPPPEPYRPAGRFGELMSRYRCLSCHSVGGFGGDLSTVPLDRIGSQLMRDYMVTYLLNPGAVRVSVEARMPVFHMQPDEASAFADYLSTVFLDDSMEGYDASFTAEDARRGQELYDQLGCAACHQLGTTGGYVGPELSTTGTRLKPGWIAAWLTTPSLYRPGTLQPDYGLSNADVRALTAYLSSLGRSDHGPAIADGAQ
ncbi:MAG TPA: c-type cytochrome [Vicinamibacterales bacterium]|nr:c-type cytochrome [Vicinamibacterales bacterium]